ncbi:hypothetical protein HF200_16575 [Streptomyces galbus]|uniref:Uncharacterized protein n=2 Tax=Streptomyces galbus TaxID=33898 RepID=A0ABX1IK44_STRGB|nr:hypothetical protein [Streptomyces galbus]
MRLNHAAPLDGGGGSPSGRKDLASSPAEKKKAAEAIEKYLEPDTHRDGTQARESTRAAAREFEEWLTGTALKSARRTWSEQLTTLMNRLGSEKAALRATNTLLQNTDIDVELGVRRSSVFDSF